MTDISKNTELQQSCITAVSGSTSYPLAFLTKANKLFMRSETEFSSDGTPRYIPNPNAKGTYSLNICMNDCKYTPIYDKKLLSHFM